MMILELLGTFLPTLVKSSIADNCDRDRILHSHNRIVYHSDTALIGNPWFSLRAENSADRLSSLVP